MIIFGTRSYITALAVIQFVCGTCNVRAAQRVLKRVTKFTLFFIPTFPVGTQRYVVCVNCGATIPITKEQADSYVEAIDNARIERELDAEFGPDQPSQLER